MLPVVGMGDNGEHGGSLSDVLRAHARGADAGPAEHSELFGAFFVIFVVSPPLPR